MTIKRRYLGMCLALVIVLAISACTVSSCATKTCFEVGVEDFPKPENIEKLDGLGDK